MLPASRIVLVGESPHAHEQEAIDFAIRELPAVEPYAAWGLVELLESTTGRLYEIDLLVLGYSALYLVEIKSGPGRYEGDNVDWYRTPVDQPARWMEPPLRLANHKAKILKSRLRARMRHDRVPRVEPLIFLSHPDIDLSLTEDGRSGVVRRSELYKALTRHQFPGAPENWRGERIDQKHAKEITEALAQIGIRKRKGKMFAGSYELGPLQDDGILEIDGPDGPVAPSGYQDRLATHRETPGLTRRARVYLVPLQTSVERRQLLRRAADREAQLLHSVREHANVLTFVDYLTDAPLGPTVLFDAFDGGVPLDAFLRKNPSLSFDQRLQLVEQVGRALAYCHRKEVQHGALGPHAVLVRLNGDEVETRLYNFQLGSGQHVRGTVHRSALSLEPWFLYQAPELREEGGRPTPASDVFSLGALAYLIFTGRAPATNVADLDAILQRDGHLDPQLVDSNINEVVAALIGLATERVVANRYDDAADWIAELLDQLTRPAPTAEVAELDPLEARKEDVVGGDLTVRKVLGHGATSRVLEVERASDHRTYALKVSLAPEHDERLIEEAQLLQRLNHPRIVRVLDQRVIGDRTCLLLSHAGEQTLQRFLALEGTVSLDYATRFGEDLLSAIEALEAENIVHRDIKPANVGVGNVGKGATHLTLFDLSLGLTRLTELGVGTAVYRDPFLRHRGAWDAAADRWSAAVTLHEMLAGIRPELDDAAIAGAPDAAAAPRPGLAAERFDAAVRTGLVRFFEQALSPDVERRFANASAMLRAWTAAFQAPAIEAARPGSVPPPSVRIPTPQPQPAVGVIRPDTAVEALPLSVGARNALDRAGVLTAVGVLALPDNRLSSVRGVGRKVAQEIFELREQLKRIGVDAEQAVPLLQGGFPGEDVRLAATSLDPALVSALADAGIHGVSALATAPLSQVEVIAQRAGFRVELLSKLLAAEAKKAGDRDHPPTLEAWVEVLLPEKKKGAAHLRALYGLASPFEGRIDGSVREVALRAGVTGPAIYIALTAARETWRKHAGIAELVDLVHSVLADAGGALPLERAGDAVRSRLPHDREAPEAMLTARSAALFRVVAEIEREQEGGVRLRRIGERGFWALESEAHGDALIKLGKAADELAARPVLASPGEAARRLAEEAAGTPLGALGPEQIADLAARASQKAARSTRLEIYPRDLAAERALELSAAALGSNVTPEEVQKRVTARYPEAAPLPARPALDVLLEKHGLKWSGGSERYERAGESARTSLPTTGSLPHRFPTAQIGVARAMDSDAISARAIDEKIAHAVDRRLLRIVGVTADQAQDAAIQLAQRVGTQPVSLDAELLTAIASVMKAAEVDREVVHDADREGPTGAAWGNLLALASQAAEVVAAKLLPPKAPLVLIQPGLLARYRLEGFVKAIVDASKQSDAAAIFLVVPAHDVGGLPRINGELPIKGVLPSDGLWLSTHWLKNKHNSAA